MSLGNYGGVIKEQVLYGSNMRFMLAQHLPSLALSGLFPSLITAMKRKNPPAPVQSVSLRLL